MKKVLTIIIGILGLIITAVSFALRAKTQTSVTVIGGADGPTSVFLAGKVGWSYSLFGIAIGIVIMLAAVIAWKKRVK